MYVISRLILCFIIYVIVTGGLIYRTAIVLYIDLNPPHGAPPGGAPPGQAPPVATDTDDMEEFTTIKRPYLPVAIRFLITLGFIGGIAALEKVSEDKGALTKSEKYGFNTGIIIMTVLMAYNFTVSY